MEKLAGAGAKRCESPPEVVFPPTPNPPPPFFFFFFSKPGLCDFAQVWRSVNEQSQVGAPQLGGVGIRMLEGPLKIIKEQRAAAPRGDGSHVQYRD